MTETLADQVIFHEISEVSTRLLERCLTLNPPRGTGFAIKVREEDKGRIHFDEHAGAGFRRRTAPTNRGGAKQ